MRIQYASDLHTEFGSRPLRKSDIKGDVLVLAGDIAGKPEQLAQSLRLLSGDVPILCDPFGYEGIETNVDWDPRTMVEVG